MTAQCTDVPADEVDVFISEKMMDYAGDYVDMQRLFEICDNKPMIERERRAYRILLASRLVTIPERGNSVRQECHSKMNLSSLIDFF